MRLLIHLISSITYCVYVMNSPKVSQVIIGKICPFILAYFFGSMRIKPLLFLFPIQNKSQTFVYPTLMLHLDQIQQTSVTMTFVYVGT